MSSNPQIFIEDDGEDTPLAIYIDPTVEDLPRLRVAMKDRGANIVTRILDARIVLVSPANPAQIKLLADEWGSKKGLVDSAWAREAVREGFAQPMDQYLWNDKINSMDLENEDDVHFVEDNAPEPARAHAEEVEPPTRPLSCSPIPIIFDRDSSLSLSPSPPPQRGPIFQHNDATPFKFFIQMRFANRMALIRLVKKHGGQPTSDMAEADYCILSRSIADFDILTAQLPRGKPAIQSEWLEACDGANRLLDWKPYVESASAPASAVPAPRRSSLAGTAPPSSAKKSKQSASASKPAPKASAASASKPTPRGSTASSSKPGPRASIASSSAGPSTPRPTRLSTGAPLTPKSNPPSDLNVAFTYTIDQDLTREPEPSTEIVAAPRGNLFTPDDNRFALQAFKWLLHRDPMTTDNARDVYLAGKAPHHSALSWASHMNRRLSAECRKLRQEAKATATATGTPRLRPKAEEPRRTQASHNRGARSPTPPSKAVSIKGGGNAFTKEEHQYAMNLWRKMVQEDSSATYTLLTTRLSEKVPQHSHHSWMAYIRQRHSAEFDAIRDKARKNAPSGSTSKTKSGYVGVALKSVSKPSASGSGAQQDEIPDDDPALYRNLTRTPPPPTHDERTMQGRVAFTPADRKWILQMHYVVLRRNLDAPPWQIAKYLHHKAPHHSEMSYSTYIARSCKNHYDNVRTAILKERAQNISGMSMSKAPASASKGAGSSTTPARKEPADLEQRVMRIAIYLDKARKQGLADDVALEALDADPCDLAPTWGAFYEVHREAVNRRILGLETPSTTTPLKRTAETVGDLEARDEKQRRMSSADTIVVDTVL